jgi:hypothetical protein
MAATAWMAEARSDPQVSHLLNEVGRCLLGGQSDWCADPAEVSKLADVLGPDGALMVQLRQVTNRQEQIEWLETVLATTRETAPPQGVFETRASDSGRYSVPVYDENYQLYYRFDNEGSVYEWCPDPHAASPEWMSQSAADAMVSKREPQQTAREAQDVIGGQAGTGDDASPVWAWNDGWGMFYRIGAAGVYEYSHSVDDAHSRPDGVWLSGEQVTQQRQQAEPARVGRPEQEATSSEAAQAGHGEGVRIEAERGQRVSGPISTEPLGLEAALGVFERAGVPELREVVEDIEALFAGLNELGVA